MSCDFIIQLSKLRKQSEESVENTDDFDQFKKYLHVERHVESELRKLLREINSNQNKHLVLLCGSAGDGKSHLISYLKNSDRENLLANFETYNDATESSEPTLTSIDTLAARLEPFNDDNYKNGDGKKMIVAINLGTLNNFIEEKGDSFSQLKKYVDENNILSGYTHKSAYTKDSVFQHVSFADYQIFALSKDKIKTEFLSHLLEKIFCKNFEENPFYKAHHECGKKCPLRERCPVRHNYIFLTDPKHQEVLVNRIIQAVIMDKSTVSTRDILNLVYDLIVHPDFKKESIAIDTVDIKYLQNYIMWTTPMLLNEYEDISPLLNTMRKQDILKFRSAEADESTTRYHSLEDIRSEFINATKGTSYGDLKNITGVLDQAGGRPEIKKVIYKFIARLGEFRGTNLSYETQISCSEKKERLKEYIQYLYYQNSYDEKKLGPLYEATKNAVFCWDGIFDKEYLCIDDSSEDFYVLEQLQIDSAINKETTPTSEDIQRFSPTLKLRFKKHNDNSEDPVELEIDFTLFELIADIQEGFRPSVQDKNIHTNFVSFVNQLTRFGDKATRVILIPKKSRPFFKAIIEETDFGYVFEVE